MESLLYMTEFRVDGFVGITDCPYGSGEWISDQESKIVFVDPRKVGTNGCCNSCRSFIYRDNKKKFVVCTGVTDVRV